MYNNKKTLAVITARGGSKGIPRKNIKDLGGKPLIVWTIEAVRQSKYLDDCVLSTDDVEIAEVAKKFGCRVPFMRPAELATDQAKSIPVVQHTLNWLKGNEAREFDYCVILQPTSPFRTAEDIDVAIAKAVDTDADSVMSMMKLVDFSEPKLKVLDGDIIKPWQEAEGKQSASRDELKDVYKRNCAIYLTKVPVLMRGDLFGQTSRAIVMPAARSVDINTPEDFNYAEWLVKSKRI